MTGWRRALRRAPLIPSALVAWGAALAAITWPPASPWIAGCLWAAALATLVAALRHRPAAAAAIALAVAAAGASSVAGALPARADAVGFAAAGGRAIDIQAIVTSKVEGGSAGLRLDADASTIRAGARTLQTSVPIAVRVAPEDVNGLAGLERGGLDLGALVRVRGTAMPGRVGERAAIVVTARGIDVVRPPSGVFAAASALRIGFVRLASPLPAPGGGLLPGLAVGDTSAVGADLDAAMKSSSLSHLTAVSGANCAVIVGLAFGAAALLGARRWVRVAVGVVTLAGFTVLVTPEPSVIRAAAMAGSGMLAVLLGRAAGGLSVLGLAVCALLIGDPWLAGSLGFALSAVATAALLVLAPPLAAGLSRWMPRALALAVAVPLAAQLACGPLLVLVNPTVPLYGVVANLVAGPAAAPATVIGLAACVLGALAPWLGALLAAVAWVPSAWVAATALTVAALPGASLPWLEGAGGVAALAALGACIVVLVASVRRDRMPVVVARSIAVVTLSGAVGALTGFAALAGPVGVLTAPTTWAIAACDVGQGDAVLVRSAGRVALVDTGPDPAPLSACLSRLGIERIDLLVLTHFDLDHVGGADAVVGRSATVLHGPIDGDADAAMLQRLADGGARLVDASAGMTGVLGDARWRIVWPRAGSMAFPVGNDASVVAEFRGGGVPTSVFLGDLSASPQAALASSGALRPPYDVVKVAHHGSADQDAGLYRMLRPALAIVSVGAGNDYGHPRAETLQLLSSAGAVIARTDREGLVLVSMGVEGVDVWREKGPP